MDEMAQIIATDGFGELALELIVIVLAVAAIASVARIAWLSGVISCKFINRGIGK